MRGNILQREGQGGQARHARAGIDHPVQHIADNHRLLVHFLFHEMPEIAFADRSAGQVGQFFFAR